MSIQDCIELYGEALSESEKAWLEGLAQSPDLLDQVNTRIETLGGERQTIIEAIGEHQLENISQKRPKSSLLTLKYLRLVRVSRRASRHQGATLSLR
jgi:hypothetical protein